MAKAKLKTGNRQTSVSRSEVRNVIERSSNTGKFVIKKYDDRQTGNSETEHFKHKR